MAWPTTDDPRTEFVTLRLTKGEATDLDTYAQRYGWSRSRAVREAVTRVVKAERKKTKRQQEDS